jgi:hypothetical protein
MSEETPEAATATEEPEADAEESSEETSEESAEEE